MARFKITVLLLSVAVVFAVSTVSFSETLKKAPDFTLSSTEGTKVMLSKLTGKVVLINFYAEWCSPCREEIPVLNQWQKKYAPELVILGIDFESADVSMAKKVKKEMGIEFISLVDKNKLVQKGYKIYGLPSSFIINADGNLLQSITEGITGEKVKEVEKIIAALVQEVKDRQTSLQVSVIPFENLTEKAKNNKTAEKLTSAVTKFLKTQKGITLSEKPVIRITGSVSMFTEDEAGLEIKFMDAATGNVLDTVSTFVSGNDFSPVFSELIEQLKKHVEKQ